MQFDAACFIPFKALKAFNIRKSLERFQNDRCLRRLREDRSLGGLRDDQRLLPQLFFGGVLHFDSFCRFGSHRHNTYRGQRAVIAPLPRYCDKLTNIYICHCHFVTIFASFQRNFDILTKWQKCNLSFCHDFWALKTGFWHFDKVTNRHFVILSRFFCTWFRILTFWQPTLSFCHDFIWACFRILTSVPVICHDFKSAHFRAVKAEFRTNRNKKNTASVIPTVNGVKWARTIDLHDVNVTLWPTEL